MEPRPPRPRTPQPGFPGAGGLAGARPPAASSGYAPGAPEAPYGPPPGAPYAPIPGAPMGGEAPLLNRQERRRQRVARGVLAFVGALLVLFAVGWVLRDRLVPAPGGPAQPAPAAQVAAEPTPVEPIVGSLASPAPTAPTAPAAANLLATATPTPPPVPPTAAPQPTPPAAEEAAQAGGADEPDGESEPDATVPLADLLPTEEQVPEGLVAVAEPADRSLEEVANQLGGTEEAATLLNDWGWEGNTFQDFSSPDELAPGATTFINVSIHRFADPDSAENALVYFSNLVIDGQGLEEFQIDPVGDSVRALRGAPDGVALVVLYVRDGAIMYRIGASSNTAEGDPTADVVALAQTIVGG